MDRWSAVDEARSRAFLRSPRVEEASGSKRSPSAPGTPPGASPPMLQPRQLVQQQELVQQLAHQQQQQQQKQQQQRWREEQRHLHLVRPRPHLTGLQPRSSWEGHGGTSAAEAYNDESAGDPDAELLELTRGQNTYSTYDAGARFMNDDATACGGDYFEDDIGDDDNEMVDGTESPSPSPLLLRVRERPGNPMARSLLQSRPRRQPAPLDSALGQASSPRSDQPGLAGLKRSSSSSSSGMEDMSMAIVSSTASSSSLRSLDSSGSLYDITGLDGSGSSWPGTPTNPQQQQQHRSRLLQQGQQYMFSPKKPRHDHEALLSASCGGGGSGMEAEEAGDGPTVSAMGAVAAYGLQRLSGPAIDGWMSPRPAHGGVQQYGQRSSHVTSQFSLHSHQAQPHLAHQLQGQLHPPLQLHQLQFQQQLQQQQQHGVRDPSKGQTRHEGLQLQLQQQQQPAVPPGFTSPLPIVGDMFFTDCPAGRGLGRAGNPLFNSASSGEGRADGVSPLREFMKNVALEH